MASVAARVRAWCVVALVFAGCAGKTGPQPPASGPRPRVTWEIRSGGEFGDRDFVCGAAEPRRPCTLAASASGAPSLATVRLFLHASATETSYLGAMRAPFIQQAAHSTSGEANVTVRPGSRPVGVTISGRVTAAAGSYPLSIAVDSVQAGVADAVRLSLEVPVSVRAASPTAPRPGPVGSRWARRARQGGPRHAI